jgi:hypothetical protein
LSKQRRVVIYRAIPDLPRGHSRHPSATWPWIAVRRSRAAASPGPVISSVIPIANLQVDR